LYGHASGTHEIPWIRAWGCPYNKKRWRQASDDAIRSLVISTTLLGTNEWLVIHHSECGMERFTQEEMGKLLKERLNTIEGEFVNWLSISDRIESVKHDVIRIRTHPLVSKDIKLSGYLFDIKTGELQEVITL
jgi:carbonic anhydrase